MWKVFEGLFPDRLVGGKCVEGNCMSSVINKFSTCLVLNLEYEEFALH